MITDAQVRYMHVLAKQLDLDTAMLHTVVFNKTGQTHITALSINEAKLVIDELVRFAGKDPKAPAPGQITQEQLNKIKVLERELGWHNEPDRLKGFIKKYTHCDNINWLKIWQASNVIEGLKKVLAKEQAKADAAGVLPEGGSGQTRASIPT